MIPRDKIFAEKIAHQKQPRRRFLRRRGTRFTLYSLSSVVMMASVVVITVVTIRIFITVTIRHIVVQVFVASRLVRRRFSISLARGRRAEIAILEVLALLLPVMMDLALVLADRVWRRCSCPHSPPHARSEAPTANRMHLPPV